MLPSFKTTASMALLLMLSACGSLPTKEKNTKLLTLSSVAADPLSIRAKADSLFIEGDILSREGKSAQAVELFEKVATLDPNSPAVYMRLSGEYRKLDKVKEAILNSEKAIEKDPKNMEAYFSLAELYSSESSYDKAISQYNEVLRLYPENSEAALNIGSLYAIKKDFKNAQLYFNSQLKNPHNEAQYLVHYYIGLMNLDQGPKYQMAAEKEFKKSLQLKTGFEDAALSLANLYLQQKNSRQALALCLEFEKKNLFSKKVSDIITQIHIENGDLDKAYAQLDSVTENSEPTLEVEMKMALILIEQKRFTQATIKLNDLLAKFPKADSARYYLAGVYEESGDQENAIRNYMLVPASSKNFSEAVVHAAYLLKGQGKINQALEVTAQGLKTNADSQVYIMRASLLDAKSDYSGAARLLEEGLTKYSQNAELLFQHAIMLDRLGKKDAMIGQMKKVLEIQPDHVQSMSYLAFSLAELNQHLSDAEELARRALKLAPQDGYVLDTLGWVLFKQKKFSESIKVLEKAYEYQSSASIIAEHLADAYSMQSQTEKAKEMYNKAVSLTTDEAQANKIRSKLNKLLS